MKLYTLEEITELSPPGLKRYFTPRSYQAHPTISDRCEFSEREREVFRAITTAIRRVNPLQRGLKCWAIGSRVTGKWRTREQSEMFAAEGWPLKYSDWDVATNAETLPSREDLAAALKGYGEKGHVLSFTERNKEAVSISVPAIRLLAVFPAFAAWIGRYLPITKAGE
jgi:hypothetical protein